MTRLSHNIFQRSHIWLGRYTLFRAARGILETRPLPRTSEGPILLSMIGHRCVLPYLVAIKSFRWRLGMGRVVIINDGSLTAEDKALLTAHCGRPQILSRTAVRPAPAPNGGSWERLISIADLRRTGPVIQIDSDTLTLGPIPEVADAVAHGRAFTLAGGPESQLWSLPEAAAYARRIIAQTSGEGRPHIQLLTEAVLDQLALPAATDLRYVRGCAGFAGFPQSNAGRAPIHAYSCAAEALLELRWHEWGSEQTASNFLIANEKDPLILPRDRYASYWKQDVSNLAFVHFLGTYRYHAGVYARLMRRIVAELKDQ
jgi:hypothetical protein